VKQNLAFLFLKILPRNVLSRLIGRLVSLQLPFPLNRWSVKGFARYYGINTAEAERDIDQYPNIQSFFTRRLKAGLRPVKASLVHPADSCITTMGPISSDELIQAKGINYSLNALLGESADRFVGGHFITYYLCPTDYHRVHSPCDFNIERVRFIPGDLWPVNAVSVKKVPQLFAINERAVAFGNNGSIALVMVGATNVGKISLSFTDFYSNVGGQIRTLDFNPPKKLKVGEEFGVFHMGSTAVLILDSSYRVGHLKGGNVKLGEPIPVQS
jgi:phosphatidylserine decarboxylase